MSDGRPGDAERSSNAERPRSGWAWRRARVMWRNKWVRVYLGLLLASHLVIAIWNPAMWTAFRTDVSVPGAERVFIDVPVMDDDGPTGRGTMRLSLWRWAADEGTPPRRSPVMLLHGSPSIGGRDFEAYAPRLASAGFEVFALDRPGFGESSAWVPSYSIRANAHAVLAAMDALDINTVHLGGWSQGGGVAIVAADIAPSRVASLALLGSIGIQEGEGSGDYYFEHAKYALGFLGAVVLPELVPHFNLLGPREVRHAFVRDFWDSDQRPLAEALRALRTPTLIVHGRDDPLVPAWVAEEHHRMVEPSRLVMLDDSHFFVVGGPMVGAGALELATHAHAVFIARHDAPGVAVLRGVADFSPVPVAEPTTLLGREVSTRTTPWWLAIIIIALSTLVSEDLAVIGTTLLIVNQQLDLGVGVIGLLIGILAGDLGLWLIGRVFGRRLLRVRFFRKRLPERTLLHWQTMLDRHTAKAIFLSRCLPGTRLPTYIAAGMLGRRAWAFVFWFTIAVLIWTPFLMLLTAVIGPPIMSFFKEVFHAPVAIVLSLAILLMLVKLVSYEVTPGGRKMLRSDLRRWLHPEFWPMWAFYAPLVPWLVRLSFKHGGPLVFTCANPGIDHGGGVVGESKLEILAGLQEAKRRTGIPDDELIVLHAELVPPDADPAKRATRALNLIDADLRLGGFPIILKPDASQRGQGLRLARTAEDVRSYFEAVEAPVQIQRFHPGPCEFGVLWSRLPERGIEGGPTGGQSTGAIFSITRKSFPMITGDGEHTIEQLIWKDKRYALQARTFLARFNDRLQEVPPADETVRLAQAGNHAQGTMFTDGSDLITPELTVLIDRLARSFAPDSRNIGGLDFGRFDIRCPSEEHLASGRGLAVIELNGTLAESTNIYDPSMPLSRSYDILFAQWARVYALGRLRCDAGRAPVRWLDLFRMVRRGSAVGAGIPVAD